MRVSRRRAAAVGSLVLGIAAVALAVALAIDRFPRGIAVLACLWVALVAGWAALRREGMVRLLPAGLAGAASIGAALFLVLTGGLLQDLVVVVIFALSVLLARVAFRVGVDLPAAPRPSHPVLFYNPLSGGGKATRFNLAEEARRRGIEPIEVDWERGLPAMVEDAMAGGADALAMAGGDGSQAIVRTSPRRRAFPTPASRPGPATISPSTSGWIATMSSAPSTPSSTGGSGASTWRR